MLFDILKIALGLGLLVGAGDILVKGAVGLALRLGIPALIVGLTVVAFGTSAPELLVSVNAALSGQPGIALGNVVGSNVANILLILGLPAIISTLHSSQSDTSRSYLMMLFASALMVLLAFMGDIGRIQGLILLTGLALMLGDNVRIAQAHRNARDAEREIGDPQMAWGKIAGFILAGLVGLAFGADLLVEGAVTIARVAGLSETVIGLTLVAIGTSLPELVTSVMAALRKEADVAMGNVIGSNIFNIMGILGVTAVIAPMPVPAQMLRLDLWVMLASALALVPFVLMRRGIGKSAGVALLVAYALYTVMLLSLGPTGGGVRARLLGLAPALARPVAVALVTQGFALAEGGAETEPPVDLLVFHTAEAGAARQALDAFAATVAGPQRVGRDLLAGAQALWLIPEGQAGTLAGVLHQAALAHAPKLRVNALHLGPARPAPAPNHAAWAAAQPGPARPGAAESLRLALEFLLQSAAVTGQVLHLETALCEG